MKIFEYKANNIEEVTQLFAETFSDSEGEEEGLSIGCLVHDLVTDTDEKDILGFVASENDQIIGSIFFTRLTFKNDINAFILSPVAVRTGHQGKGVGQKLINFGVNQLKERGVTLLVTYGDPNFYSKVGFQPVSEEVIKAPLKLTQPEGWLCQSLVGNEVKPIPGDVSCVEALNKPEYW